MLFLVSVGIFTAKCFKLFLLTVIQKLSIFMKFEMKEKLN